MVRDETILDVAGIVLIAVAVLFGFSAVNRGAAPIEALNVMSPLLLGGIASITGVGGVMAFLKNR